MDKWGLPTILEIEINFLIFPLSGWVIGVSLRHLPWMSDEVELGREGLRLGKQFFGYLCCLNSKQTIILFHWIVHSLKK